MVDELLEGEVVVELVGLAGNCVVRGDNPRTLGVVFRDTVETEFDVACHARLIAFTSDRGGDLDIYVVEPGGGAPTRLTTDPGLDIYPSWSPRGRRVAFYSNRDGNLEI